MSTQEIHQLLKSVEIALFRAEILFRITTRLSMRLARAARGRWWLIAILLLDGRIERSTSRGLGRILSKLNAQFLSNFEKDGVDALVGLGGGFVVRAADLMQRRKSKERV